MTYARYKVKRLGGDRENKRNWIEKRAAPAETPLKNGRNKELYSIPKTIGSLIKSLRLALIRLPEVNFP